MLRVIELFSGLGSQTQALKNIGVEHRVIAVSDNDRFADLAYRALHDPGVLNLGDIRQVEELPPADLWTYSFPCQDISVAGHQKGLDKESETRSGLLWEVERLLIRAKEKGTLPKYLLLENVKNLIGKRHKANYDKWVAFLSGLGYQTYSKVLNAKHYGVPQNRERVFAVSILGDHEHYAFPQPRELTRRLKDILEEEVDKRFFLKESTMRSMLASKFTNRRKSVYPPDAKICGALLGRDYKEPKCVVVGQIEEGKWGKVIDMHKRVYDPEGIAPTLATCSGGNTEKKIIVDDLYAQREMRAYEDTAPTLRGERNGLKVVAFRGRPPEDGHKNLVQQAEERTDGVTNTITTVQKDNLILENCTIRKLTPTECWRLMGWADEQITKVKRAGLSNSQMYKQAGNGIVVAVMEAIFKNLFKKGEPQ